MLDEIAKLRAGVLHDSHTIMCPVSAGAGVEYCDCVCREYVATIDALAARIAALEAEVARLRKALKPGTGAPGFAWLRFG